MKKNSLLRMRIRSWLAPITIVTLLLTGLQLSNIPRLDLAQASVPVAGFCGSTNGTGGTRETSASLSGSYMSNVTNPSDSVTGLIITPIFSKRMYVDVSRNFDATYIGYRIENTTATTFSQAQIQINYLGEVIKPVTAQDLLATVNIPAKTGSTNGQATAYFFVRATGATEAPQTHEVRVVSSSKAQLAGCKTEIQGVQRSISASANKVTAISVSPSIIALGQTFTISVSGAPGNVGNGSGPDLSVMAFSPASNSRWPSGSVRLETVSFTLNQVTGNPSGCGVEVINGSKSFTSINTLVIRNFKNCIKNNKQTYVATYTFRLINNASVDPVIRPLSSIASGTQVKYTGTLPSANVTVPIISAIKPVVSKTANTCSIVSDKARVPYVVSVTLVSGSTTIDKIRDHPAQTGATFVSASYSDEFVTNISITKTDVLIGDQTYWDFEPANKFKVSSAKNITLTYLVDLTRPTSGSSSFSNSAYALYGDVLVASGNLVTGVSTALTTGVNSCVYTPTSIEKPKAPQAITFDPLGAIGAGSPITITAFSDSGLPVTLVSETPMTCSVTLFNSVYTLTAIAESGDCIVSASQSGDSTFGPATPIPRTVTILSGQVISHVSGTFGALATTTVQVSASSRLEVSLASLDTDVCTVNPSPLIAFDTASGEKTYSIIKGATGTCILSATQPGNSIWAQAPSKDIAIGVGLEQYISFSSPVAGASFISPTVTSFSVVATARKTSDNSASQTPVYFSSSTPLVCSVVQAAEAASGLDTSTWATTVTISILSPGTCSINANQDGLKDDGIASGFASAPQVSRSFQISGTGTTAQTLSISDPGAKIYGAVAFNLTATSARTSDTTSTGLLVALATTTPSVCELGTSQLSGVDTVTSVRLVSAGTCALSANQAGNNTFSSASQATLNIVVTAKTLSISGLSASKQYDGTPTASLTGTPLLTGIAVGDGLAEISLIGAALGSYLDGSVNTGKAVLVSGFSLGGSKALSYTLSPLTVSGAITTRPITVKYNDATLAKLASPPICGPADVTITSGSLAALESLDSINCVGVAELLSESMKKVGDFVVRPEAAVIKRSGQDVSSSYAITYQTGTLSVTDKILPQLVIEEKTVVYGTLIVNLEVTSTTSSGVQGKNSAGDTLAGTVAHKNPNGSTITELSVGVHDLPVEFNPSDTTTFSKAQGTRRVTVIKRKLRITGISATDKIYDGTTNSSSTGSAALEVYPADTSSSKSEENGYGLGLRYGDVVNISGALSMSFGTSDAGDSKPITVAGYGLSGAAAGNYEVSMPVGLTARILKRPLTLAAVSKSKLLGEADPALTNELQGDTTFAAGENATTIGGITTQRTPGETVGEWTISPITTAVGSSAARDNYQITILDSKFFIAKATIGTTQAGGVVTAPEVICVCEGFKPGATVTLTMHSTPTILDIDTVASDGTCPALTAAIPAGTTGDHNLIVTSFFPNDDPLTYNLAIKMAGVAPAPSSSPNLSPGPTSSVAYTVKLNYIAGTSGPAELKVEEGSLGVALPTSSVLGARFLGWSEKQITRVGATGFYIPTKDVELWQVWQISPIQTRVLFRGDSAVLTHTARATLKALAEKISSLPQKSQLYVDGWVKRTRLSSYDTRLSRARANNSANYLESLGIDVIYRSITPRGVHPNFADSSRRAEISVFFSGSFEK